MASQQINDLIAIARAEHSKQLNKLVTMRQNTSCEDFKELFIVRAQQAMADRKNFSPFIIDDNNRQVINMMYGYIMGQGTILNPYIGIVLNGNYGCGKSVLIEAFCMVVPRLTLVSRQ